MTARIDARTLRAWLCDGGEIALIDVREPGRFGEAHLFFAVPLPYSRFELGLRTLVPRAGTRLVLCDEGDGIAERAAKRAARLGYTSVHVLEGGTAAWKAAGHTLYAGVNVPSKTFGELVELQHHTPRVTAAELQAMREGGEDMVIVDGRTAAEFHRMNIPGGQFCPNGELALRIGALAPDPKTKIVVNCAGRTRSIIGAQTLIDFGVPNPVVALENGTQGWFLAGLKLENGATPRLADGVRDASALRARARSLAEARGVGFVDAGTVARWLADPERTTYVLDVRTPEEFARGSGAGAVHAAGGQLVQSTDQWIGTRGARTVLLDDEGVRAPMTAQWLRQLGHEAYVLDGGVAAAAQISAPPVRALDIPRPAAISAADLAEKLRNGAAQVIDLRPSASYRKEHIAGAAWSVRPRIAKGADTAKPIVLVADEPELAALAALDLTEAGARDVRLLAGGQEAARTQGIAMEATPGTPADADRIDFLFFTAARHEGDAEAARQYLTWEIGLVDQLDDTERASFRIAGAPSGAD